MLKLKTQLLAEIELYCKANNISDPDKFCNDMLERAFMLEKYGKVPDIINVPKTEGKPVPDPITVTEKTQDESTIIIKKDTTDDDYEIYDHP